MDILQLIDICYNSYSRTGRCLDCPNSDCMGSCSTCLDEIHMNRIKRRYNCSNITYCYVCKYLIKYSSEIFHLFTNYHALNNLNELNILSIECGPCPDLFGIIRWMQANSRYLNIKYRGFDLNNIWGAIQNKLIDLSKQSPLNIDIKIYNKNIFTIYKKLKEWRGLLPVNILIMQYVLSDMVANNNGVDPFLQRSIDLIIKRMPTNSFIIINDINHNTQARNYFEKLISLLNHQEKYIPTRYHFVNNKRPKYFKYGMQHPDNGLFLDVPDYISIHNPWTFCSSAQLVIQKV